MGRRGSRACPRELSASRRRERFIGQAVEEVCVCVCRTVCSVCVLFVFGDGGGGGCTRSMHLGCRCRSSTCVNAATTRYDNPAEGLSQSESAVIHLHVQFQQV